MYSTETPYLGQGGTAPTIIDLSRGNQFFVRFPSSHGSTVYLYDKTRKIFVPFTSASGFTNFTGGKTPEQAYNDGEIYDLDSNLIDQMGIVVPDQNGFNDQGHVNNPEYYQNLGDSSGLDGLYGKTKNSNLERRAADTLGTLFTTMKNSGSISQGTFDTYIKDPVNLARYINAWVYGGYTIDDVFRDIKAKELGLNVKAFDPIQPASAFYQTSDHAIVANNAQLAPPTNLNVDPSLFNNPIFSIPGDAFQTLIPTLDKNSAQYKTDVANVQSAYHDLLLQQLDANTTQAKAIADDNYKQFKDQLFKKYGIQLSDNSVAAWNQIQQLSSTAESNNMADSGVFNEALDRTLATQRKIDERTRENQKTEENSAKKQYYLTQATPSQIKNDLTPEERTAWGLVPTSETLNFVNNLKTTYPTLTDEQVKQIRDSLIDENGNLRSQLYSNLFKNKLTTTQNKTLYQENIVQAKNDQANQKAYAPYTKSDNPFIRDEEITLPTSTLSTSTPTSEPFSYKQNVPSLTPPQQQQNSNINDLSSKYGLYNNTVYDLSTGLGFSKPEEFFNASGVNSFNNIKLNTGYKPTFYKYSDNPTVYNAINNKQLDYDSYLKSGGSKDFSGIEIRKRQ